MTPSASHPIYVIGSGNVDHIMRIPRLPERGETVTNGVYLPTFGGKGANSAVAAAKAGGRVSFVGCVGDDVGGTALRAELEKFHVQTPHLRVVPGVATGQALVMVGEAGGNYLSVAPGANHRVEAEWVRSLTDRIEPGARVLLQNEIPAEVNRVVLAAARRRRFACLFNFAPALPFPLEDLRGLDYLIVNENEADNLLAAQGHQPLAERDPTAATGLLRELGVECVVLTVGARGAVVATDDRVETIPSLPVKAIDTTAAGDTFCGTLAVALAEGADAFAAARFANRAAALSVTRAGAMISSPTRGEIETFSESSGTPPPNLSNNS
ncbi:MAG: ribokinase [Opitutales bacterium]|nr:ribokinase [Opitutales bacterium]